ncbi:MAG: hypothetical protein WBA23_18740 [Tunicatimonas sp.]|uniref:hypothetical protein n=1 Tax=Tunicatimonas sp. TaxID=1940096 RepID=UPI003C753310
MSIRKLRKEYLTLTNQQLPQLAKEQRLPVRFNHCFQRIILDTLFQDCWYNHLSRKGRTPAYQQLNEDQLAQAIILAEQMIKNPQTIKELNRRSLQYRGKLSTIPKS